MNPVSACSGFHRSQRRVAELRGDRVRAGDGLRPVEPGMPAPAGTGISRRRFLLRSAAVAASVYGASRLGLGALEEGIAQAAGGPPAPVLVSVFLPGGLDGLSVLAPAGDPVYRSLRPTLRLAPDANLTFADDPRLQWHPAAAPLKALHEAGKVCVFPSIGYDHDNQSHFTSRHYWELGAVDPVGNLGWLGRYLDRHGVADNPLQGIALSGYLAPALATRTNPVCAIADPTRYDYATEGVGGAVGSLMLDSFAALGGDPTADVQLAQARLAARQAGAVRSAIAPLNGQTIAAPVSYPSSGDPFVGRLKALAAMLTQGLPIRCVAVDAAGSYDTHANQAAQLSANLTLTFATLAAFQADLEARGLADRVVVHVWSEFGRRAAENGGGTDHGAAGVGFLIGTRVRRQVVGEWAGVTTLDERGNMRHTSDFRVQYAALLDQWLGADAAAIIPGADTMALPQLIAA